MNRAFFMFSLLAMTTSSAVAVASSHERTLFDFHLSCEFANAAHCTAVADVYGAPTPPPIRPSAASDGVSAQHIKNNLIISCDNRIVFADGATVTREHDNGFTFAIHSDDHRWKIDLADEPFNATPNPKTVNAELRYIREANPLTGTCTVTATEIVGNDSARR